VSFVGWWDGWQTGFGNHLALFLDDARAAQPCYLHVAHLDTMVVQVGQRVPAGALLGTCGKSGNQPYAHTHAAMWPRSPAELGLPGGWDFWQTPGYAYPRDWVASVTIDPEAWFWASVAKAGQAPPEVVSMILSGAQAASVQAVVWGEYWNPDAADFAIPSSWRAEWRRGVWRGAPLSSEQLVPEDPAAGKPAGSWMPFEYGACVWLPGEEPSWNG
jgi:murein DD-endopeptidase MepM/ murein hydrolase activator NlpD